MDKLLKKLLDAGTLRKDQCCVVETEHWLRGESIATLLLEFGFVSRQQLSLVSHEVSTSVFVLDEIIPDIAALQKIGEQTARKLRAVPLCIDESNNAATVALPFNSGVLQQDKIRRQFANGCRLKFVQLSESDFAQLLDKCYGFSLSVDSILDELNELVHQTDIEGDSYQVPIVRLIDAFLHDAVLQQASDLHFCPEQMHLQVRVRLDGVLSDMRCVHIRFWQAMLVRLKILANIDIAETRFPQDGQFSKRINGERIDFRASSFPVRNAENIVLRILDRRSGVRSLQQLSLQPQHQQQLAQFAHKPAGMLVVCGPTGMGKTTTLYALIHELNHVELNIMTLEDPIEFAIPGIRQTRVSSHGKLSFAEGVKGVLRQDPDVLLIGEIRDSDSCDMAVRAAMSGHRVFTSLHAADNISAIERLLELGASANALASVLTGVVSQRLLRRFCNSCLGNSAGCDQCSYSGFKRRIAVVELLGVSLTMKQMISRSASTTALSVQAKLDGMQTLEDAGKRIVQQGITSQSELQRVLGLN